jgi:hypothetical protein
MNDEEIDKIARKVFTHPNAEKLEIKRIPKDTVKIFKDFANEQFVGDYGMCLKSILDEAIEYQKIKKILLESGKIEISLKSLK